MFMGRSTGAIEGVGSEAEPMINNDDADDDDDDGDSLNCRCYCDNLTETC